MTREEAIKMLKAKLECMIRDTSGSDYECNNKLCDECPLNYEQGNMGQQQECIQMAIKALEQKPKIGQWRRIDKDKLKCSKCEVIHFIAQYPPATINFCPNCGADMRGDTYANSD